MIRIETPRLVLRRWSDEDVHPFARINADPEVMRWIGDGSVRDEEQARRLVEQVEGLWEAEGYGLFAVELRETGEFAGFAGLAVPHFLPEVLPAVEIGWRLARPLWGRGLATEAARAALRYAFTDGGLERIVSICQIGNTASERIMVRLGMRPDRDTVRPGTDRPTRVYAMTRAQYQAQH
ncbi:GNAT family N-acetyltransferase [Streptacidiphilus sp. PB12-B1b]|uniref:GNAT family N-acetyltransferase n=1 Tax=Streptacidiphilus sp. PB12-B1b TaxID=2705012 RepID=UPI0015FDBFC7|nr:GNAT family N-acetyltransferase [Streptacidiphilus sp. PB12-B1b]QMU78467.1 GNAT family N-acetyltransferase [Streptacidiphilus sp. PB12-B1b]